MDGVSSSSFPPDERFSLLFSLGISDASGLRAFFGKGNLYGRHATAKRRETPFKDLAVKNPHTYCFSTGLAFVLCFAFLIVAGQGGGT